SVLTCLFCLTFFLSSFFCCLFSFAFSYVSIFFFFFNDPATTEIYTLSLHDALPILPRRLRVLGVDLPRDPGRRRSPAPVPIRRRSEEHTSELQSPDHLVCRLLLEKKKKKNRIIRQTETRIN